MHASYLLDRVNTLLYARDVFPLSKLWTSKRC